MCVDFLTVNDVLNMFLFPIILRAKLAKENVALRGKLEVLERWQPFRLCLSVKLDWKIIFCISHCAKAEFFLLKNSTETFGGKSKTVRSRWSGTLSQCRQLLNPAALKFTGDWFIQSLHCTLQVNFTVCSDVCTFEVQCNIVREYHFVVVDPNKT